MATRAHAMLRAMPNPAPLNSASYAARINFVVELAERLHAYGTTAQRLEGAVTAVAQRLKLECEPWSNPTGMILTFSDPLRPLGDSDTTRVIRLPPGETDLIASVRCRRGYFLFVMGNPHAEDSLAAALAFSRRSRTTSRWRSSGSSG